MPSRGIRGYVAYAGEKLEQHFPLLHRNLRPDFHTRSAGRCARHEVEKFELRIRPNPSIH